MPKNTGFTCDRCRLAFSTNAPALELTPYSHRPLNREPRTLCSLCVEALFAWIDTPVTESSP